MRPENIRLFIKPYCGWCHEAMDWLRQRGLPYEVLDVAADADARQEMFQLSGQPLAPVIQVSGQVLANFSPEELEAWWQRQGFDTPAPA